MASQDRQTASAYQTALAALQQEANTGDLILCSGGYWQSWMIRSASRSTFSHVAVVERVSDEQIFILESIEGMGVTRTPLITYFENFERTNKPYVGLMFHVPLDEPLSPEQQVVLLETFKKYEHYQYDGKEYLKGFLRVLFGGRREEDDKLLCSEMVEVLFDAIGRPCMHAPDESIFPEHVRRSLAAQRCPRLLLDTQYGAWKALPLKHLILRPAASTLALALCLDKSWYPSIKGALGLRKKTAAAPSMANQSSGE